MLTLAVGRPKSSSSPHWSSSAVSLWWEQTFHQLCCQLTVQSAGGGKTPFARFIVIVSSLQWSASSLKYLVHIFKVWRRTCNWDAKHLFLLQSYSWKGVFYSVEGIVWNTCCSAKPKLGVNPGQSTRKVVNTKYWGGERENTRVFTYF